MCLLYLVISCYQFPWPKQSFTACHAFQDDELEENLEEGPESQVSEEGEGQDGWREPPSLLTADNADKAKAWTEEGSSFGRMPMFKSKHVWSMNLSMFL